MRAAAGLVEQQLDRGAVDDIEIDQVSGAAAAQFERRRVTSPMNIGVQALFVNLLIPFPVEINFAWGQ